MTEDPKKMSAQKNSGSPFAMQQKQKKRKKKKKKEYIVISKHSSAKHGINLKRNDHATSWNTCSKVFQNINRTKNVKSKIYKF